MITLLFILVFLLCQTFILLCCVAAGNDAASQEISDQEQIEFINEWKKTYRLIYFLYCFVHTPFLSKTETILFELVRVIFSALVPDNILLFPL